MSANWRPCALSNMRRENECRCRVSNVCPSLFSVCFDGTIVTENDEFILTFAIATVRSVKGAKSVSDD
jgi:hypothetical protein